MAYGVGNDSMEQGFVWNYGKKMKMELAWMKL